jgi:hypothetical protein
VRVHGDFGQPTEEGTGLGPLTVIQAGVTLALGPVGLGANVGALRADVDQIQTCSQNPSLACDETQVTASALAQIRVAGGGSSSYALSIFGGASTDITARQIAGIDQARQLTIPLGAALGIRLGPLNVWGAPRVNVFKAINCPSGDPSCDETETDFRWAAGADLPILRILSIRAAYESGKIAGETVSVWGIGASIGLGGMR